MCNMEFSWIPTDEYLRMLRSDLRLVAVGVERLLILHTTELLFGRI